MKYFVLFSELRFAIAEMVQIAGVGLLLMWRFNAVIISLHKVFIVVVGVVIVGLSHLLFELHLNICNVFVFCVVLRVSCIHLSFAQ